MKHPRTITHVNSQQLIVNDLKIADSFLSRLKGLIGSSKLTYRQGMLITPCQQVHTHFMSYVIDVVFLDRQLKVLHVINNMPPWRFSKLIKSAYYVLELPAEAARHINVGDLLTIET
jgi:uncharacterized membrane protein (UPF0127 family)